MLKEICKPAQIEDFLHAASVLKKHERINSRVFLMIGFPNETYRMILDTFTLALQMDLDWYNITMLQPLPNTPIMESMMEQGLAEKQTADQIRYNCGAYGKKREKWRDGHSAIPAVLFLPKQPLTKSPLKHNSRMYGYT